MQFDKPFVYTHTNLHTYADVCPYRFYRTYVKKDIPYVATAEMDWGNQIHSAFEYRVGGGKPLPANMRQWEPFAAALDGLGAKTEVELAITAAGKPCGKWDKDVAGRGKADVVIINGATAYLWDWKSGSSKYESPSELALHAMMLKAANPYLTKVVGNYVWLKENRVGVQHDLSDFNSTWARTNNVVEQIKDSMLAGEFEKRRTGLCGYCSVTDCENRYDAKAGERR